MSNLRFIGIIVGCLGLLLSFRRYRGQEWNRGGFISLFSISFSILSVSINPNLLNIIVEIFALNEVQRGRIIFLIISSVLALFVMSIANRNKTLKLKYQLDLVIKKLSSKNGDEIKIKSEPIMILIPAFNEEENLQELLKKIPKSIDGMNVGVLVVDDGSTDNTYQVAIDNHCIAIKNFINRGQGAASRLGYDLLSNDNVKIIVTMDADNQHRPEDIITLILAIKKQKADFVIGSRILGHHSGKDFVRNIGIHVLTGIINFFTGQKLTDCSSGFKAFNVKKLHEINLFEDQFQSSEVIIEAAKSGLKIVEVPITIVDRTFGSSKKGTNFSYGINFFKVIIKTWWRKV